MGALKFAEWINSPVRGLEQSARFGQVTTDCINREKRKVMLTRVKLYGDVSGLSGRVSGLSGDVSELSGDVSGLSGRVSGLYGYVSGLSGDVSGLSGDVATHVQEDVAL